MEIVLFAAWAVTCIDSPFAYPETGGCTFVTPPEPFTSYVMCEEALEAYMNRQELNGNRVIEAGCRMFTFDKPAFGEEL